ncbi:flagellar protein export ATPase FliI [Caldanaerobius polysaccharolyticus]|uniref:flagellar protein export ATPase FliI n=1 Tax=Caldanaerobius polysaccharolyticus TaxID=44256 RepID=UPI00047B3A69|nr:flagellar protein export ATPase FliI [Caldanaerobius polysaccharolyticus]
MNKVDLDKYQEIQDKKFYSYIGHVTQVVGLTIRCSLPYAQVGELCRIEKSKGGGVLAEVVGFDKNGVILMAIGDTEGIRQGCTVRSYGEPLRVRVSSELRGRVLNGLGKPIDGNGDIVKGRWKKIYASPPNPLVRKPIKQPFYTGIRAIDGLLTCGKGQRFGIFAGSGVGKSTLMGMIARSSSADVNVIALIGERGREVNDFIDKALGAEGMKKSVLVVSTSDEPAMVRLKAAYTATAIAEYFRDCGCDVMFMMDSVTRFAMAQREIGLAVGEPPVSKGYTPSVFSLLPKLMERTGNAEVGSITALYTVLVDGDDFNEPVTDAVRSILDGHIVLSRKLANSNHYPAIDVLASVSRVMTDVVSEEHLELAGKIKNTLAVYRDFEDLISIGAYKKGNNPEVDYAIEKIGAINSFLRQKSGEVVNPGDILKQMKSIVGD